MKKKEKTIKFIGLLGNMFEGKMTISENEYFKPQEKYLFPISERRGFEMVNHDSLEHSMLQITRIKLVFEFRERTIDGLVYRFVGYEK